MGKHVQVGLSGDNPKGPKEDPNYGQEVAQRREETNICSFVVWRAPIKHINGP